MRGLEYCRKFIRFGSVTRPLPVNMLVPFSFGFRSPLPLNNFETSQPWAPDALQESLWGTSYISPKIIMRTKGIAGSRCQHHYTEPWHPFTSYRVTAVHPLNAWQLIVDDKSWFKVTLNRNLFDLLNEDIFEHLLKFSFTHPRDNQLWDALKRQPYILKTNNW